MRMTFAVVAAACFAGLAAVAEEPPPIVNGGDATVHDIAGTSTLVTVVLKDTGAEDKNLRILDVYDNYFVVLSQDKERTAYLFSSIKEIRVQGGKVDTKKFVFEDVRTLRAEEQKVVERAYARAQEIFSATSDNQSLKMHAAALLAINGDQAARDYLEQLAAGNDLKTALDATACLFLLGEVTLNKALLASGLESGNRKARAKAAILSGLLGDHSNEGYLMTMLQDRVAELAKPAAWALSRLGNRDCIPTLLGMIVELSEEKGEGAIFALSRLDGPDVAEQMKLKYDTAVGEMRFRIAQVLYNIEDPMGRDVLANEFMTVPTLAERAALILAREGHPEAMQFLRSRLDRRFDEIEERLVFRAEAAAALIEGGDPVPIAVLQELLRFDRAPVTVRVCELIAELGKRQLLPITQPAIENSTHEIALAACTAAIAIANPNDFREKLIQSRM